MLYLYTLIVIMLCLIPQSLCFFPDTDPGSVPLGAIIGVVVAGLLVLIAVIAGFVVLRNKNKSGKCDGHDF